MKHIADALNQGMKRDPEPEQESSTLSQEAIEWVDGLFNVLNVHVTYFRLNHTNNNQEFLATKREWVKTFQERHVSDALIRMGVIKLRLLKEPLKNITPAEFLSMCTVSPDDLGLPHVNEAYNEAIANYGREKENPKWSHPVVRHAAYYSKSFELMNLSRDKSFALFEHNYQQSIKMFINGELGEFKFAIANGQNDEEIKKEKATKAEYKQVRNGADALKLMKALL